MQHIQGEEGAWLAVAVDLHGIHIEILASVDTDIHLKQRHGLHHRSGDSLELLADHPAVNSSISYYAS